MCICLRACIYVCAHVGMCINYYLLFAAIRMNLITNPSGNLVPKNHNMTLKCLIEGHPSYKDLKHPFPKPVSFFQNGVERIRLRLVPGGNCQRLLLPKYGYKYACVLNWFLFIISNVKKVDEGEWWCAVTNVSEPNMRSNSHTIRIICK